MHRKYLLLTASQRQKKKQMKTIKMTILLIVTVTMSMTAQVYVSPQNTATNRVSYENKIYTVHLGKVVNNGQGNVTVEILTDEKIEIPIKNGSYLAPIMAKIEAGGRTFVTGSDVEISDNSMLFNFGAMPDKVIIYGNDGNANGLTATFVMNNMVGTQQSQPVIVQSQPTAYSTPDAQQAANPKEESGGQYSYLIPKEDIIIAVMDNDAASYNSQKISMILPGTHTFEISQQTTMHGGTSGSTARSGNVSIGISYTPSITVYSNLVKINATLEAGKYYTFDYKKIHKGIFKKIGTPPDSIVEITDSKAIEKNKKILVNEKGNLLNTGWAQAHPDILSGTYKIINGKAEITFTGNTFHSSVPIIFRGPLVYDGTFFFNEKMIILKTDSINDRKKEKKIDNAVAFLSYKLLNGILNITDAQGSLYFLKGQYFNDSSTISQDIPMPLLSLEGNYTNGKKQITFTGNTFRFSKPTILVTYIYDGTFVPNANGMTITIKSVTMGKMKKNLNITAYLSCKLEEEQLDITDIEGNIPLAFYSIKGQYQGER